MNESTLQLRALFPIVIVAIAGAKSSRRSNAIRDSEASLFGAMSRSAEVFELGNTFGR